MKRAKENVHLVSLSLSILLHMYQPLKPVQRKNSEAL